MSDEAKRNGRRQGEGASRKSTLAESVGTKAKRKIEARRRPAQVWFGLGMMGLIGWSVVTPTLLGAAIGAWLDRSFGGRASWTLALLLAGLMIGCMNAWYWVAKEDRAMRDDRGEVDRDPGDRGQHDA